MIASRDVGDLREDVRRNCLRWLSLCAAQGLEVLLTQTLRDDEYQARLYAQGRTAPGSIVTNTPYTTFHGAGLAFDFCKNQRGHEYDDAAFFARAGALGKSLGFTWGGDWKSFPDRPHLQWDAQGAWTGAMVRSGQLPPEMPAAEQEEQQMKRYQTMEQVPPYYRAAVEKCIALGALRGGADALDLSEDLCRVLTVLDRLGALREKEE